MKTLHSKLLAALAVFSLGSLPIPASATGLGVLHLDTIFGQIGTPGAAAANLGYFTLIPTTVHDGLTDDYSAIAAVFSACNTAGGGNIYAGSYRYAFSAGNLVLPPNCHLIFDSASTPEVTDYSGDYSKVKGAFLHGHNVTLINSGGAVENINILNSSSLTTNPNSFRAVLNEIKNFSPPTASISVTAGANNGHAAFGWTNHGLKVNSPVRFSGSLPSGLYDNSKQVYFVASEGFGANSFEVSTYPGGTPINVGANATVTGEPGSVGYWQGPTFGLTSAGQASGRDSALKHSSIIGFDIGEVDYQSSRGLLDDVNVDANTCYLSSQSYDWTSRRTMRCEGFVSNGPAFDGAGDQSISVTGVASGTGNACLVAMASTGNFANGDTVWATGIGGLPSCNGRFTASVVDGTHLLLSGSSFVGGSYATAFWTAGQNFVEGLNGLNWGACNIGSNVTGTNVPANSHVIAINYAQGKLEIDQSFASNQSSQTIACSNPGYTSGGTIWQSTYWRYGPAFVFLDETGGMCLDCFSNGHRTGYYLGDGPQAFGVVGLNLTAPNVDGINDIADLDSYGIEIAGHSQGVTMSGGPIATIGVGIYAHSIGSNSYTNHFIGLAMNSNLGDGLKEGILWDIESAGNTITGGGSRGSNLRAWFSAGATNSSLIGFNGPTVSVDTQSAPTSLSVDQRAGNILSSGFVGHGWTSYTPTVTPNTGTASSVTAKYQYDTATKTLFISGSMQLSDSGVTNVTFSLPNGMTIAGHSAGSATNITANTTSPLAGYATNQVLTFTGTITNGTNQSVFFSAGPLPIK